MVKAKNIISGEIVAIKCLNNMFDTTYHARSVLREIVLLSKLTEIQNNIYTPNLIDLILPEGVMVPIYSNKEESKKNVDKNQWLHSSEKNVLKGLNANTDQDESTAECESSNLQNKRIDNLRP